MWVSPMARPFIVWSTSLVGCGDTPLILSGNTIILCIKYDNVISSSRYCNKPNKNRKLLHCTVMSAISHPGANRMNKTSCLKAKILIKTNFVPDCRASPMIEDESGRDPPRHGWAPIQSNKPFKQQFE